MKRLLLTAALLLIATASLGNELPFVEDDFGKAVARARANNVPIFVESWAPW